MKKIKVATVIIALLVVSNVKAQFSVGADFVSNYVFRGVQQDVVYSNGTPNIQPTISYTIGGFTIGTWGSYAILGTVKEIDIFATYAFTDFLSVTLTDYNYLFTQSYFNYGENTDHVFEGSINYAGVEAFPLSASLNTMFYGADKRADGNQAFSTYLELAYPIVENVKVFLGTSFTESLTYGTDGFGVTNVGIKAGKSIQITENFSLPVFGILGFNPNAKDAYLVAGITL